MSEKKKEIMVLNPVHYAGKIGNVLGPVVPFIAAFALSCGVVKYSAEPLFDTFERTPDKIGWGHQNEHVESYNSSLSKLKEQSKTYKKAAEYYNLDKKYDDLKEDQEAEFNLLKSEYETSVHNSYRDLLLNLADSENGSGLTEKNFKSLRSEFKKTYKYSNILSSLGYDGSIETGSLDECILDMPQESLSSKTDIARYSAAKSLNNCMAEELDANMLPGTLSVILLFAMFTGGTVLGGLTGYTLLSSMEDKPKRINIRPKPRIKKDNH